MNDASHAGGSAELVVDIRTKSVRAANGGAIEVLRDLSLALPPGRLAALLGPSGCGKTTLLRCIAGLDTDYEGCIALPQPGKLGMVFQEPRLLPWRTVEDNIRIAVPGASTAAVDNLLAILHLADHRRHYPAELSLGLARRVALARAFAVEPALLLLDEPFVSLDAPLAAELRVALTRLLARRPMTALLVTHDAAEAAELADTVLVLTPRPARVLARIDVPAPRATRSPGDIEAIAADIGNRMAGRSLSS